MTTESNRPPTSSRPSRPPPPSLRAPSVVVNAITRTDESNPHKTADASYVCTHRGMCNKLWNVMWHDHGSFEEHLQGLQSFQNYSHLPGLSFFARKVLGARSLVRGRGGGGRGELRPPGVLLFAVLN